MCTIAKRIGATTRMMSSQPWTPGASPRVITSKPWTRSLEKSSSSRPARWDNNVPRCWSRSMTTGVACGALSATCRTPDDQIHSGDKNERILFERSFGDRWRIKELNGKTTLGHRSPRGGFRGLRGNACPRIPRWSVLSRSTSTGIWPTTDHTLYAPLTRDSEEHSPLGAVFSIGMLAIVSLSLLCRSPGAFPFPYLRKSEPTCVSRFRVAQRLAAPCDAVQFSEIAVADWPA